VSQNASQQDASHTAIPSVAVGVLCGIATASFWAAGLAAAKHGVAVGFTPGELAFHRYVWAGVLLLPAMARVGLSDLGGIGWTRGIVIMMLAGPVQAISAYTGFSLVPLAHGAVIQPGTTALVGLVLAFLVLGEPVKRTRVVGLVAILAGLLTLAGEAAATIGGHGVGGDLLFATAGLMWAVFTMFLRQWRIDGFAAARVVVVLSLLLYAPLYALLFGFDHMMSLGLVENLLQILVQGVFAGLAAIYLFGRAVTALGAGRASTFAALVPAFTILIGFIFMGETPTLVQLAGLAIVGIGFRLALKT